VRATRAVRVRYASRAAGDRGQTVGIYIVAMAALFFLAFAYFAVGQASVARNGAQTAADAAALAAARADRDAVQDEFLAALMSGDAAGLTALLGDLGSHAGPACSAASAYAEANRAEVTAGGCVAAAAGKGYTVTVKSRRSVGTSVVPDTEKMYAKATATAVVDSRCTFGSASGHDLKFSCKQGEVTLDPTSGDFRLDLSTFYTVHLSR
jgi:Flp pilus assembly protein TadG